MRIRSSSKDLSRLEADLAVCFAHENDKAPRGIKDAGLRRELARQMQAEDFKGRPNDRLVWNTDGRYASHRFLVIGLGPEKGTTPGESLRVGCASAGRAAAGFSARSLALRLPPAPPGSSGLKVRAATEGALLGAYQFDRYLTDPLRRPTKLNSIELASEGSPAAMKRAVELGRVGGRAVCLARDLVNEAPSRMTPQLMAREAARRAKAAGLSCRVLGDQKRKHWQRYAGTDLRNKTVVIIGVGKVGQEIARLCQCLGTSRNGSPFPKRYGRCSLPR